MVALRKESVDRNSSIIDAIGVIQESLSARRAWIEIGSVSDDIVEIRRRSPQGERG